VEALEVLEALEAVEAFENLPIIKKQSFCLEPEIFPALFSYIRAGVRKWSK